MNLLFAFDQKFSALFLQCIHSIARHGGADHYDAYILASDLTAQDQAALTDAVASSVTLHFIAMDPSLFDGLPESERYPRQIYYRILAPLFLPEDVDRILYLDVDTVVINPLTDLYAQSFDGAYYMACTHIHRFLTRVNRHRLRAPEDASYVNTGVMMLDIAALRPALELDALARFVEEQKQRLILPDQDILFALYGDKIKLLDSLRYNLSDRILRFYNADPSHPRRDVDWVRKNTVVIHYCGKAKPWKDRYVGKLDVFYWENQADMAAVTGFPVPDTLPAREVPDDLPTAAAVDL
jgi:lipopolysaccharide biosynthesis glycosyltransferase